ncbi:MAG: sigma-70 family RNA polymerase sigma factor [Chloroflexi bacterium]|nr:sigma-70 family RNA polymerase sigma factor [Chloroflexota bacterium]
MNEQDLIIGAKAYNADVLGIIYDCYSPGIYRYAMRRLGDTILSEDCVAETFSRFLKAIRSGQGPKDHLQAYLYRIAHNWIVDIYRQQSAMPIDLDDSLQISDQSVAEDQIDTQLKQNQIRLALRDLTPDQQQVITLRFIEGWENEEVAAALGKPVGAIKALQHRALKTLRRLLLPDEKESVHESEG